MSRNSVIMSIYILVTPEQLVLHESTLAADVRILALSTHCSPLYMNSQKD
jgi:hypothetical protein